MLLNHMRHDRISHQYMQPLLNKQVAKQLRTFRLAKISILSICVDDRKKLIGCIVKNKTVD